MKKIQNKIYPTRKFLSHGINKKSILLFCIVSLFIYLLVYRPYIYAETVEEMNKRIEQKKNDINALSEKVKAYQDKIKEMKKQSISLKNQLEIINVEIEKNEFDIQITEKQIQKTNLEIQKITLSIDQKEKEIEKLKKQLMEFIRVLYGTDQVSYLEVILMNDSFSDFFDQYQYLQNLQNKIHFALVDIKNVKSELEIQKSTLEDKRKREVSLKKQLDIEKSELLAKSNIKETLLSETQKSEKKFQSYVKELKGQEQEVENDIVLIEKKIRAELEKRKKEEKFKEFGPVRLQWPIPSREITAGFHDPDYPFRYLFEHPAIDIRSSQGTPIKAAEAGYVARVKNGGLKRYSYIMILHSDGVSTVYGHVSSINVKENQYVNKGEIIGNTGGKPGTPGAGPWTTGPHLHLEVRKNGIPVNPLDYLP